LESCRAPTLLAELEDDDEMPEPDDDENDDDENEDDDDYEEVMVSRNLLSFMVHTHMISILSVNVMPRNCGIRMHCTSFIILYRILKG
jgi:hypothetical protein